MKNSGIYFLLLPCVLFLLGSCKVEKRLHQPGYHVEWVKASPKTKQAQDKSQSELSTAVLESTEVKAAKKFPEVSNSTDDNVLIAGTGHSQDLISAALEQRKQLVNALQQSSIKPQQDISQETCETVVLTDGRRLTVKVLEITQTEVRYRKCNYPDGPVVVINKTDVDRVIYENGAEDIISGYSAPRQGAITQGGTETISKRLEVLGLLSMIFGILGLFVAGIPLGVTAVILGFISLGKFASRPNEFMGRGFMIAGLIIGFLAIIGTLLVISMAA